MPSTTSNKSPKPSKLKVALMLSYPNSGTSYTTALASTASKTTTASNYMHECAADAPSLYGNYGTGPVFFNKIIVLFHPSTF
jgi:hypothetical protein